MGTQPGDDVGRHLAAVGFVRTPSFIGPNGAGKSTVLRVLDWYFNGKLGSLTKKDCPLGVTTENIEVQVAFNDLSNKDREALGKHAPDGLATFTAWKRRSPDGSEVLSANAKGLPKFNAIKAVGGATATPLFALLAFAAASACAQVDRAAAWPTPAGIKPGSISCEECPYPHPSRYLPLNLYGQDLRMAYMDVPPQGAANGATVLLLHGNNFGGFYFGNVIDALSKEGFRVVVPDQIGYGRSSKPAIPYNFHDMAANTRKLLEALKIPKVMVVGHSMGGMAAARFATQNPEMTERVVLYNPIGVNDARIGRRAPELNEIYKQTLGATYASIKAVLFRYVGHNPSAWNEQFETYARVRYAATLGSEWPRYAMAQALITQMLYVDQVVDDWARIQAPTLAFGGAEDLLAGSASVFQERMKFIAAAVPNGKGRVLLLPGLGHVPHIEAPERTLPPLIAFLNEGVPSR